MRSSCPRARTCSRICSVVCFEIGHAAVRAVRHADRRPEQAQVIVDFGDGSDGGPRAAVGGLLLDRDGRAEAVDGIDLGPLHLIEELARVRRQRLHVAPLALGVDRVERQRRLAGSAQPGDHRQRVAGNLHVDVLQIVHPGAVHGDSIEHRRGYSGALGFALQLAFRFAQFRMPLAQAYSSARMINPGIRNTHPGITGRIRPRTPRSTRKNPPAILKTLVKGNPLVYHPLRTQPFREDDNFRSTCPVSDTYDDVPNWIAQAVLSEGSAYFQRVCVSSGLPANELFSMNWSQIEPCWLE